MANIYQTKYNEFQSNLTERMFLFEVTKHCGYSTFVPVYKTQTLLDLYNNVIHHFGSDVGVGTLYFLSAYNQDHIRVPLSHQKVQDFVSSNITSDPVTLTPIYNYPCPVIYRLYLDDGRCHQCNCSTDHYR
jgi:hypothetical protein